MVYLIKKIMYFEKIKIKNILKFYISKFLKLNNIFKYDTKFGKVYLDEKNKGISKVLAVYGSREDDKQDILTHEFNNKTVYIDLGSNIGVYPVLVDSLLSKESFMLCIEPDKRNLITLKKNLKECNSNRVFLPIAISDKDCNSDFFISNETNLNYLITDTDRDTDTANSINGDFDKVKCIALETLIKEYIPLHFKKRNYKLVLRMDIEGGEYKVLKSLNNFISNQDNRLIFKEISIIFESHPPANNIVEDYHSVLLKLLKEGFHIKTIICAGGIEKKEIGSIIGERSQVSYVYSDNFKRLKIDLPKQKESIEAIISERKLVRYCSLNLSSQ